MVSDVVDEKMVLKLSLEENSKTREQGHSKAPEKNMMSRNVLLEIDYRNSGISITGRIRSRGPIFVSSVEEGSPAEGLVHAGDQILSVNGCPLLEMTADEANEILLQAENSLNLQLQYKPDEMKSAQDSMLNDLLTDESRPVRGELYVRALYFLDLNTEHYFKYYFGDILQITHKPDRNAWVARKVFPNGSLGRKGLIASAIYHKEIGEEGLRRMGFTGPLFSYLVVQKHFDNSIRPIVVLGAQKKKFIKHLVDRRPELLGRIVSLSPKAIRAMHRGNVYPIVIFNGIINAQRIIEFSNSSISLKEAEKEVKEVKELTKELPLFTIMFYGMTTVEQTITWALDHIDQQSAPNYWIPCRDQTALLS